jgi:hypothetical protein
MPDPVCSLLGGDRFGPRLILLLLLTNTLGIAAVRVGAIVLLPKALEGALPSAFLDQ